MPIDTTTVHGAGWWLEKLGTRLQQRRRGVRWSPTARQRRDVRPGLDLLDDYLRGDPPLPHVAQGWRDALLPEIRQARMNYADLSIVSALDRLTPMGWATAVDSDPSGDDLAASIATANQLRMRSKQAMRWMLAFGEGYMMVGPPQANGMPLISAEDPRETITAPHPVTGESMAALKLFRDEWTGDDLAYVFIPGAVAVARRPGSAMYGGFTGSAWEWDEARSSVYPDAFSDLVPVVRFANGPDARGDFEGHLDVLDRINSEIFRRVSIAIFQAFRQRAVMGLPTTSDGEDPAEDGSNVIDYAEILTADPGSLWNLPAREGDQEIKFWESGVVSLDPIRAAIKDDVQSFAAVTRTPLYSLFPDAANASAQGATVQREGLYFRCLEKQVFAGAALDQVMAMAFRYLGEAERADLLALKTLWRPVERYSLAEMASAGVQAKGVLPRRTIWSDVYQYPPEDIAGLDREWDADLADQALQAELAAPKSAPQPDAQQQVEPPTEGDANAA